MELEFLSVPRLVFGAGQFRRLGELAATLRRNALVVTNAGKVSGAALAARLSGLLSAV